LIKKVHLNDFSPFGRVSRTSHVSECRLDRHHAPAQVAFVVVKVLTFAADSHTLYADIRWSKGGILRHPGGTIFGTFPEPLPAAFVLISHGNKKGGPKSSYILVSYLTRELRRSI